MSHRHTATEPIEEKVRPGEGGGLQWRSQLSLQQPPYPFSFVNLVGAGQAPRKPWLSVILPANREYATCKR